MMWLLSQDVVVRPHNSQHYDVAALPSCHGPTAQLTTLCCGCSPKLSWSDHTTHNITMWLLSQAVMVRPHNSQHYDVAALPSCHGPTAQLPTLRCGCSPKLSWSDRTTHNIMMWLLSQAVMVRPHNSQHYDVAALPSCHGPTTRLATL